MNKIFQMETMRKNILILLLNLTGLNIMFGNTLLSDVRANEIFSHSKTNFIENKGQMADMNNQPVPFVLFKAEAQGIDLYITEKGLTYLFKEIEEKHEKNSSPFEGGKGMLSSIDKNTIIKWSRVDMDLKGASIKKENIITEGASSWVNHYYLGHCPRGIRDVHSYKKITIKEVYPGIDWVFYNSEKNGYKYDFIVHPGADYRQIQLAYSSPEPLKLNKDGGIEIKTELGTLTEHAPYSYTQNTRREISSSFQIAGEKSIDSQLRQITVSFLLNSTLNVYNSTLIIDPKLVWATFLGGGNFEALRSLDSDPSGNIFGVGSTTSVNFPVKNAGTYFYGTKNGASDVVILKFNGSGGLLWSTYYGGNDVDISRAINIDAAGNVFLSGCTASSNFPTQNAGTYFDNTFNAGVLSFDVFILKFDNSGNCLWATYYGGSASQSGFGLSIDATGNVFVTGNTKSVDFPTQDGGTYFDGVFNDGILSSTTEDAFILKFDNSGKRLWATYYGGKKAEDSFGCCVDAAGNVFVTGRTQSFDFATQDAGTYYDGIHNANGSYDAFILKFDNSGNRLWATFYGGNSSDESGMCLRTDAAGDIFVTGYTWSSDFPTQNAGTYFDGILGGAADAFILKFDTNGNRLWATYYGGSGIDGYSNLEGFDNMEIDGCGNVYVTFDTESTDITKVDPGCGSYYDGSFGGGTNDIFITRFSNSGILQWASYFGYNKEDYYEPIAISRFDGKTLFLGGVLGVYFSGTGLPLTNPGGGAYYDASPNGSYDSFIAKFTPTIPTYIKNTVYPACVCNGSAAINVCGIPPFNYAWSTGIQTFSVTSAADTITGLCTGNYWVEVTDADCNKDTVYYTLIDTAVPKANAGNDLAITKGFGTVLNGSGGVNYFWAPSAGLSCTTCQNPTATPMQTTTYYLTVTDDNGCTDIDSVTVTVEINCNDLFIPNAFSPNGDGENDIFYINGGCIKTFLLHIYDRWGEKVFQTDNINTGWNGSYHGKQMNAGVFFLNMEAIFINGDVFSEKKNLTLIK